MSTPKFEPSNMLKKYLAAQPRDIYDIVGALIGYINADPYFETNDFKDAIEYVLNQGISENELYQPFDSDIDFQEDETKWDDDYYSYARVYLKDNFCKKRISHVKKVARKLHPVEKETTPSSGVSSQGRDRSGGIRSERKKSQDHQEKPIIRSRVGIKGLIICVAIILMVFVYLIKR